MKYKSINLSTIIVVFAILTVSLSCKKKEIPVVKTSDVINVAGTTATSGGAIVDEGSDPIISKGICWSTSMLPTIDGNKTNDGSGANSYKSTLTGLSGATTYYIRAYATNAAGTGYGLDVTFKTLGQQPSATTLSANKITSDGATLTGTVNANYLSTVVTFEFGEELSYGQSVIATPGQISDDTITIVTADLTGLKGGTIYHFRIKAENSLGVTLSTDNTFKTLGQLPSAVSLAPTNITVDAATLNGTVNANYLPTVVTFEYGEDLSYGESIIASPSPVTGNTVNNVSADLSGLNEGTVYHFRIKAENSLGVTLSTDNTFKTLGQLPSAVSLAPTNITVDAATLNGTVNANYLPTVVTFEYGEDLSYGESIIASPSPITGNTINNVSADLTGLSEGVEYHYRIRAENSLGVTFSDDYILLSGLKDYDNNPYHIIYVGTQIWMAENLSTTKYNDGTPIPNVTDNIEWSNLMGPAYCWYDNNISENKVGYGALYNWFTVNSGKLCPIGWHVPSNTDWSNLINFLGGATGGGKLKETGTLHWNAPNSDATNGSGFTALPSGYRSYSDGVFFSKGDNSTWWSSTLNTSTGAGSVAVTSYNPYNILVVTNNRKYGESVRCLKDN